MENRLIRFALVGIALTIINIDAMQTDFTQPGSTNDTVKLRTRDDVVFLVDATLAKQSETIKNHLVDVSIDKEIPLPNVTGVVLSRILMLTSDVMINPELSLADHKVLMDKRKQALSLQDYVNLLAARNYLDIELAHRLIFEGLIDSFTLMVADLETVLGDSRLPDTFKKEIIAEFARRSRKLDSAFVEEVYAFTEISLPYRLFMLKELIKNNRALLQSVVGVMPMLYKESRDRGEDPEEGSFDFPEASGKAEEVLKEQIEDLLGDNYIALIERLEEEYPEIQ